MSINPAIIGVGAGLATGAAATFGGIALTDGIAERNPTGSSSDWKSSLTAFGIGAAGVAAGVGLGILGARTGNQMLTAGAIGVGVGGLIGGIGTAIGFNVRHGIGVDTLVNTHMSNYNHDAPFDDHLDLYRVEDLRDLDELGLEDWFGREGVALVEWGERVDEGFAAHAVRIDLADEGPERRVLTVTGPPDTVARLRAAGEGTPAS